MLGQLEPDADSFFSGSLTMAVLGSAMALEVEPLPQLETPSQL